MRPTHIALIADTSCDLPAPVKSRFDAQLLPLGLQMADAFSDQFKEDWVYHYDSLQAVTPAARYSPTYQQLREAFFEVQPEADLLRQKAYLDENFRIRLLDSGQLYAGYGLVMHEVMRLHRQEHVSIDKLRQPLEAFKERVCLLYSFPDARRLVNDRDPRLEELGWLTQQKLRWVSGTLLFRLEHDTGHRLLETVKPEEAIDHLLGLAIQTVEEEPLENRLVNASFAGSLEALRERPLFRDLYQAVLRQKGQLWLSTMSAPSAGHLGPGAFSLAFTHSG